MCEKYFSYKEELTKLKNNGWLSEKECNDFLENKGMENSIIKSTSPTKDNIFNALKLIDINSLRVVILGQDPYPNPNHAHGLAFSSKDSSTPESLKNIFRAIDSVYNTNLYQNSYNDLTEWAKQGVLLLNTSLTFQKYDKENIDKAQKNKLQQKLQREHMKVWKPFIKTIISKIIKINSHPVVMMLWGNNAHDIVFENIKDSEFKKYLHQRNGIIIPNSSVLVLQSSHPSPLSVNRGGDFLQIMPVHLKECENFLGENKIHWEKL